MRLYLCILVVLTEVYLQISAQVAPSVRCLPLISDRYRAVNSGEISVECTAAGVPEPSLTWTDNAGTNEYLNSSVSFHSQSVSARLFICTAQNMYGTDRCFVGVYFLSYDTLYTSLLEYLNESHSYNLTSADYSSVQCSYSRISIEGVVSESEVVESLLLVEKTQGMIDNEVFNTYLHIFYELMCVIYKDSPNYGDFNPFFGDNIYRSALILHDLGSDLFGGEVSKFQEFSLYLLNSLLLLESRFDLGYGESDRMNITDYLLAQGLITLPPPPTTTSSNPTSTSYKVTSTIETHTTIPTTIITDSPPTSVMDIIDEIEAITLDITHLDEFENVINRITPAQAQDGNLTDKIAELISILTGFLKNTDDLLISRSDSLFPPLLIQVQRIFETFVSKKVEELTCPQDGIEIEKEFLVVSIGCINASENTDKIILPEMPDNTASKLFPTAEIPVSVIKQFFDENNNSAFPISVITYNVSVVFPNNVVTTRIFSLNFPTTSQFTDKINISFQNNVNALDQYARVECVFIDTPEGNINTSGVELVGVDENSIVCATSHATSFTAIVSFNRDTSDIDRAEYIAREIVSFILLSFSFLALVISLILFCLSGKHFFMSLPNVVYFNYAIALTFGCSSFLFLLSTGPLNKYYCVVAVFITQYSWIAVFSWSLCVCITLILFLKDDRVRGQVKIFWVYFILSWGVPIIPCLITLFITIPNITDDYISHSDVNSSNANCYLSAKEPVNATLGLIGPVLILLILNLMGLVFFSCKLCWLMRPKSQPTFQQFKRRYLTLYIQFLILISILGLPWLFLLVNIFLNYFSKNETLTSIMEWVFLILNAPIGVIYFFAYTIKNKQVRTLFSKNIFTKTGTYSTVISNQTSPPKGISPPRGMSPTSSLPASLPKARKRNISSKSLSNASDSIPLSQLSPVSNPVFAEHDVLI